MVVENPRRCVLPGAISGEHKLWRMPHERLRSMQSGLIPVDTDWSDASSAPAGEEQDLTFRREELVLMD